MNKPDPERINVKDRILRALAESFPNELRFSELREKLENPSRSVFSEALRALEQQKLITRTEISYKHVTYVLNAEEYEKKLKEDRRRIDSSLSKIKGEKINE